MLKKIFTRILREEKIIYSKILSPKKQQIILEEFP